MHINRIKSKVCQVWPMAREMNNFQNAFVMFLAFLPLVALFRFLSLFSFILHKLNGQKKKIAGDRWVSRKHPKHSNTESQKDEIMFLASMAECTMFNKIEFLSLLVKKKMSLKSVAFYFL